MSGRGIGAAVVLATVVALTAGPVAGAVGAESGTNTVTTASGAPAASSAKGTTAADGTTTVTGSDGTTTVTRSDGTETVTAADGTRTVTTADGTRTVITADGTKTVTRPDGTTTVTADGTANGTVDEDATSPERAGRRVARATPAAELAAVRAAVAADGKPGAAIRLRAPSRTRGAFVAKLLEATTARKAPDAGRTLWRATTRTRYAGQPTRLLIDRARYDDRGRAWLRVSIPRRPNRTWAWIPAASVVVERTPWFVSVSTGRRLVRVYLRGKQVRRVRAVVGAPGTPTPTGLFAVYESTYQRDPRGFIGPGALHLTAFSDVLDDYGGGPGVVAIHGRGPAALVDPLGSARSHGCVRVANADLLWLRARLGGGTPVLISR